MIKNALYDLKSSGTRFHLRLPDSLTSLGFVPFVGRCDIWMRDGGKYYSYLACYCDDIIVLHKDPYHVFTQSE